MRNQIIWYLLLFLLLLFYISIHVVNSFTLVMMGTKRRGGKNPSDLKRILNDQDDTSNKSINRGKGQVVTGVTLPDDGELKGWEFGNDTKIVCGNIGNNQYYAIQGNCPRCGFDLWKGSLLIDDSGWESNELPRVACPTCSTTFHMKTGIAGSPLKRTGLSGFVSGLAQTATSQTSNQNAKAFMITVEDNDDKIYCRER